MNVALIALICGQLSTYDVSISKVERTILTDPLDYRVGEPQALWYFAHEDLQSTLLKYGPRARTFLALGDCAVNRGVYQDAMGYFERARRITDGSEVRQRLDDVNRRLAVVASIQATLKSGRLVRSVINLGNGEWAATSSHSDPFSIPEDVMWASYGQPQLHFWKNRRITHSLVVDDYYENESTLVMRDFTGDGRSDLALLSRSYGATITPARLMVFERRGTWRTIADFAYNEGLWVKDHNRDGIVEINGRWAFGDTMSHAEQPRWTDIFTYRNGRYVLANAAFPRETRESLIYLRSALRALGNRPDPGIRLGQARAAAAMRDKAGLEQALTRVSRDAQLVLQRRLAIPSWRSDATRSYRRTMKEIADTRLDLLGTPPR